MLCDFRLFAIGSQLSPEPRSSGIEVLETDTFKLHCHQTMTGTRKMLFNPIALRMAKTLWRFGQFECNRIKHAFAKRRSAYTLDSFYLKVEGTGILF